MKTYPSNQADRFLVRFDRPGHREELKALAAQERRSLNSQINLLIEAGQKALQKGQKTQ